MTTLFSIESWIAFTDDPGFVLVILKGFHGTWLGIKENTVVFLNYLYLTPKDGQSITHYGYVRTLRRESGR